MIRKILVISLVLISIMSVSGCQSLGSFVKPDEFSFGGKNNPDDGGIKEFNWGFKWKLTETVKEKI